MGLSSTTNRVVFTGDGSSTVFAFPYYFFSPSDLDVYLYSVTSSVVTAQTLNTNFTVSGSVNSQGVYPSGGSVITTCAIPTALQIVITRAPSPVQNYNLLQNGPINAVALTQQLDYITALVQRLQDEVSRSVQMPDGLGVAASLTAFDPTLPQNLLSPSLGGAALVLNSGATGFQIAPIVATSGAASVFLGTVTYDHGGTGQNQLFTTNALWYSQSQTALGQLSMSGGNKVLTAQGSSAPIWQLVDLTASVSGLLPAANGGLGSSFSGVPTGTVLYFQGSTFVGLPPGASGTFLAANGSSTAPTWSTAGAGVTAVGAFTGVNSSALVIAGANINMTAADTGSPGGVSIVDQPFSGNKTFLGATTLGASSATTTNIFNGGIRWTTKTIALSSVIDTTTTDTMVLVQTQSSTVSVFLPAATNGRWAAVMDSTGNASSRNITIRPQAPGNINGASSVTIATQWGSWQAVSDGTNWYTPALAVTTNLAAAQLGGVSGVLGQSNGGTGQNAKTLAFNALTPQTTKGDLTAYATSSAIRFPTGSEGQYLTATSSTPSGWQWVTAAGFTFSIPKVTIYNSGISTHVMAATTQYARVKVVAAGAGGSGSGAVAATAPNLGLNSQFGSGITTGNLTALGGAIPASNIQGGAGGSFSLGSSVIDVGSMPGGSGGAGAQQLSSFVGPSGVGGSSIAGGPPGTQGANPGPSATANTGAGGAGAGLGAGTAGFTGPGGGGGGIAEGLVPITAGTSFIVVVAGISLGGAVGSSAAAQQGGNAGSGKVIVMEFPY